MSYEKLASIGKIFGIYALALVAAVACGEGFKPLNRVNMSPNAAVSQAGGMISNIRGNKVGTSVVQLNLSFIDGAIAVPNVAITLVPGGESYNTVSAGNNTYRVSAYCADQACEVIAVLVDRQGISGQARFGVSLSAMGSTISVAAGPDARPNDTSAQQVYSYYNALYH
jgi:hypothetical protein